MDKMDLLEEKIRKATDLIRSLREERNILEDQLKSSRAEMRRLSAEREDPEMRGRLDQLTRERETIVDRLERMITIIDEVEAS